ncbi:MAG: hypothetical protein BMS9Abin09_0728 [Gammaproteobacteria bacterium]|nr:MAG: hypothetical protein BMS9Abin09_0728 [Gammaproteobacteria bacterium]
MPMHDQMNAPWMMGGSEWLMLTLFWVLSAVVIALVIITWLPKWRATVTPKVTQPFFLKASWRSIPEVQLAMLGLPLSLLWEIAQFPLYTVWHQNDWGYILYGLAHCTLGDVLILLAIYEVVALLNTNRHWVVESRSIFVSGLIFTLAGVGYTIFSEITNVRIKGTWGYTELMPIVPFFRIGGMPFLQWLLIPPVLLWLMRLLGTEKKSSI